MTRNSTVPNWKRNIFLSPRTHRQAYAALLYVSRGGHPGLLGPEYADALELIFALGRLWRPVFLVRHDYSFITAKAQLLFGDGASSPSSCI